MVKTLTMPLLLVLIVLYSVLPLADFSWRLVGWLLRIRFISASGERAAVGFIREESQDAFR